MNKKISWSEDVWNETKSIVEKIKHCNFIQQMMEGTLNENIFKEYILQDIMYCDIFNSCMKYLGEKLDVEEYKNKLLEFSQSKSSIAMREMYKNKVSFINTILIYIYIFIYITFRSIILLFFTIFIFFIETILHIIFYFFLI